MTTVQNWLFEGPAKLDRQVVEELHAEDFVVLLNKDGYPVLGAVGGPKRPCHYCRRWTWCCPCPVHPVRLLHLHVYDFFVARGLARPLREGEVLHHRNHDKFDARFRNLGPGTRAAHAATHNAKRQRFSTRKRFHSGGLYRPRQPARVLTRHDLIGQTEPPRLVETGRSLTEQIAELERVLEKKFDYFAELTAGLDSGVPIPPVAPRREWRKSRMLGISMPTLGCSRAEVAFVLALIAFRHDENQIALEVGQPVELLREIRKRVAVDEAVGRWARYKRLPKVSGHGVLDGPEG